MNAFENTHRYQHTSEKGRSFQLIFYSYTAQIAFGFYKMNMRTVSSMTTRRVMTTASFRIPAVLVFSVFLLVEDAISEWFFILLQFHGDAIIKGWLNQSMRDTNRSPYPFTPLRQYDRSPVATTPAIRIRTSYIVPRISYVVPRTLHGSGGSAH